MKAIRTTPWGQWLKATRDAQGLSQDQLAFRAEVSARLISRYERGEGDPSTPIMTKLAEALGVALPWSDLVTEIRPGNSVVGIRHLRLVARG